MPTTWIRYRRHRHRRHVRCDFLRRNVSDVKDSCQGQPFHWCCPNLRNCVSIDYGCYSIRNCDAESLDCCCHGHVPESFRWLDWRLWEEDSCHARADGEGKWRKVRHWLICDWSMINHRTSSHHRSDWYRRYLVRWWQRGSLSSSRVRCFHGSMKWLARWDRAMNVDVDRRVLPVMSWRAPTVCLATTTRNCSEPVLIAGNGRCRDDLSKDPVRLVIGLLSSLRFFRIDSIE